MLSNDLIIIFKDFRILSEYLILVLTMIKSTLQMGWFNRPLSLW